MRLTFTTEQRALRAEFHAFAKSEVAPAAARHDREERVGRALIDRLAEAGFLASLISPAHGGRGLDHLGYGLLHEEMGRACSSTRSLLTVHDMVAHTVERWGDDTQRRTWLPRLTAGTAIGAFALSEPDAGSDVAALATRATADGDAYRLDGTKCWISFGAIADVFLVFARADEGLTAFLVERDTPGLEVVPLAGMLGTRGAMLAELRLTGCRVPRVNLLAGPGRAHPFIVTEALTLGRYSVASGSIGIVGGCLAESRDHAAERGLMEHQLVQRLLTRMTVHYEAGRLLTFQAGELIWERHADASMAAVKAKYLAATNAAEAARDAVQVHGAAGCTPDHPVNRYYRDAKVMEIIEGSTEVSEGLIGRFGHADVESYGAASPKTY
ncbi:acyl-CoA dehydrogenase family protein [Streptomyces sp. NPDC001107]